MRSFKTTLFVLVALCVAAGQATAFEINMVAQGPTSGLLPNDSVVLDVFLDAEPGLTLLSVGVLFPDDGTVITYDRVAAFMLPPNAGAAGTSGALSSYILYTAAAPMTPSTTLYPNVDNAGQGYPGANFWNTWNGINQPNSRQVNVDYVELSFAEAPASGTGIYIGTVLFDIQANFTGATLALCVTCGGNTVNANSMEQAGSTILSAPIVLTPEPAIYGLAAAALGVTVFLRSRRRSV